MKKYIYILLLAALCNLLGGCNETEKIEPGDPDRAAKIEVSNNKLIFDADGGCAALTIAATTDGWQYESKGDWFTIVKVDDNTLEVTASMNGTPILQSGSLTITGSKGDEKVSTTVTLTQRTDRAVNLSAAGTANCYLVQTGKYYKFDATIKGNGNLTGDGHSTYIKSYGIQIDEIAYADLMWETRPDGDKTMSREIIDGAPIYRDGYVAFSTGRSEGNALLVVKNSAGKVLWSWHIWVCDDTIETHPHLNAPNNVVAQIMDRNLGALNNEPMDVRNRGMFYQWGRKDPFPPSRSPYFEQTNDVWEANETNDEIGNGVGTWVFHETAQPITTVPGNIPYTVQYPMTFLVHPYNQYDWYCVSDADEVNDSGLWAEAKTIFDPCPVGYKVPGKDMWGIPAGNKSITTGGRAEEYDENGESALYDWNIFKGCGRTWKYTGDFYPASGTVAITEDHPAHNTSSYAFYWTSQVFAGANTRYRGEFTGYWAEYFAGAPVFTAQIRCVKE